MNRIVIILILLGSLFCLSGCIEISYKTEAKISFGGKKTPPRPRIIDNGYPYSPKTIPAIYAESVSISKVETKKRRGFKKFTKKEI